MARQRKLELQEQWASGKFTDQSQFGTAILNAKAIGNCETLDWFLDLDYEALLGEIDDGEPKRTGTEGESSSS